MQPVCASASCRLRLNTYFSCKLRQTAPPSTTSVAASADQVANAGTTAARKTAGSFERALRNTVEMQPYTAVVIALVIGWLLGRMHRPL
jgi:hypothetical protein